MKKILIIDDDPVIRETYSGKLKALGYAVDAAEDGEGGLLKLEKLRPDLLLLDMMMPKFNGLEIIAVLRAHEDWKALPILVLTSSYNTEMMSEAWRAGATLCLSKLDTTPKRIVEAVCKLVPPDLILAHGNPTKDGLSESRLTVADVFEDSDRARGELRMRVVGGVAKFIEAIELARDGLAREGTESERKRRLEQVSRAVHLVAGRVALAGFRNATRLAGALETLLMDLSARPNHCTESSLDTVFHAVNCLVEILAGLTVDGHDDRQQTLVMAVDDDPVSLEALSSALGRAGIRPVCIDTPAVAIKLLARNRFDLVFMDVDMPQVKGFDVCRIIKKVTAEHETPVVFVSAISDTVSRDKAESVGGSGFLSKPFLPIEVAVKALTLLLRPSAEEADSLIRMSM